MPTSTTATHSQLSLSWVSTQFWKRSTRLVMGSMLSFTSTTQK
jgi:hypothetical protein